MIGSIQGTVRQILKDGVLVETASGVGYIVHAPQRWTATARTDQTVFLRTYLLVREDALELYGFANENDLALFELLLTVDGVGPRSAMNILQLQPDDITSAVQQGDVGFFSGIPRLGKKTAQKIIIELQTKLGKEKELEIGKHTPELDQAVQALIQMGYNRNDVLRAAKKLSPRAQDLDSIVKQLIKTVGSL